LITNFIYTVTILIYGLFIAANASDPALLVNFQVMEQTISITVSGLVQGVYYRQSTKEKALELGVSGIVKNLPDGNVHILATGTADQLNELVHWCKQGPPLSKVSFVNVEFVEKQVFMGFVIQRS
jgi:acylphosphatase